MAVIATKSKPLVPLMDWQRQWIEDDSRFKVIVAATQSGKSFATSLDSCISRMARNTAPLDIMLSASERQSVELMEKVKIHTAAWKVDFDSRQELFEGIEVTQHVARFPNGKRIIALPANPATARGYSGDVFLDEFALHKDADSIWAALFGRITRGFKLRVASTIHGKLNKFYKLLELVGLHEGLRPDAQPVRKNGWSGHWVDIWMCREQGSNVDIEGLREALGDEDIFQEEYCNVPIDGALDFIPLELVIACESEDAQPEFDYEARPEQYAGWDFARKRDLSVIWILRRESALSLRRRLVTVGIIYMRRMKFDDQKEVGRRVARSVDKLLIDSTGIGANIVENLTDEFPSVVEGVDFTGPKKEVLATGLKIAMEDLGVAIPFSLLVRRAFQAVKRFVTSVGNIRYDAARTDKGHADEFWAAALAVQAAANDGYVPASEGGMVGAPVLAGMMGRRF